MEQEICFVEKGAKTHRFQSNSTRAPTEPLRLAMRAALWL